MYKSALSIAVFLGFISLSSGGYNIDYLTDNCVSNAENRTLYLGQNGVSTYGIIRLTRENDYGTNLNCAMRIVAPDDDDYNIQIDVTYVDIYAPNDDVCMPDYLLLYGNLSLGIRYCGHGVPANNLVTLDNWFEVHFVSGSTDSNKDSGFDLHYNLFYPNNCTGKYECASGVSRCILPELLCDNRDNCGDLSDEWSSVCGMSSGAIAAIVIMSLLLASIIAVIVVYCLCEKRWKKQRERQRQLSNTVMWSSRGVVTPATPGANVEPPPAYTFSSQLDYANPYLNHSYSAPLGDAPVYSPPYSLSPSTTAAAAASSDAVDVNPSSASGQQGSQSNNDKY